MYLHIIESDGYVECKLKGLEMQLQMTQNLKSSFVRCTTREDIFYHYHLDKNEILQFLHPKNGIF